MKMTDSVPHRLSRGLTAPTLAVLGLVLVLVTGTFAALATSVRGFHDESGAARRAERVLGLSARAERDLVDVETGLRGYLLTRREHFLEPFYSGRRP
jgi:CHASE3 domain sensor protein